MIHIYHEVGRFQAILGLYAEDRMGLIYELSRALFEQEFDITRGRAVTRQGVVSVDFRPQKTNRRNAITVSELRDLKGVLKDIVH